MYRLLQHALIAGFSVLSLGVLYWLLESPNPLYYWSMSTAYIGLLLLAVTLLIGPLNLIRKKNNPISGYLRRDIGIWAGIISILHVVFGLQRHFTDKMWLYFVRETEHGYVPIINVFGLALWRINCDNFNICPAGSIK